MTIKEKSGVFMNSDECGPICFDRKHIGLLIFLFCYFAISLLFGIHGYSISVWRDCIDGSAKKEILIGKERSVRSDDWAVEIPMMLAQLSHDPKYPLVNTNIATGSNMISHSKVPIRHVLTFFRPTVWGFFIGADFGLSWMWQTMVLGMFYVFFLVFMIVSRNNFHLSLMGSLFLLFSPFFQFWSFHKSEIPIFMGLSFISFCYLCFARKKTTIILHAGVLGWALSCFALNFVYPPFHSIIKFLFRFFEIQAALYFNDGDGAKLPKSLPTMCFSDEDIRNILQTVSPNSSSLFLSSSSDINLRMNTKRHSIFDFSIRLPTVIAGSSVFIRCRYSGCGRRQ